MLQCVAVCCREGPEEGSDKICCCSMLQCVAVCFSVLQRGCRRGFYQDLMSHMTHSCLAVRCSMLQCVAVCCSVLQCDAVCCRKGTKPEMSQMTYLCV